MHLTAAAEITPSGVPPMPHRKSTGRSRRDREQRAGDVAVGDQPHARAGRRGSPRCPPRGAGGRARRPSRRATSVPLRSAISSTVLPSGRSRSSRSAMLRRRRPSSPCRRRARGRTSCRARTSAITASAFGMPVRAQARALERVDGDVDLRRRAVADRLAVVEHRRLVLLALADHHDAVHVDRVQHGVHAVDGGLVGRLLVAACRPSARPAARRPRSRARARARGCGRAVSALWSSTGLPVACGCVRSRRRGWRRRPSSGSCPAAPRNQPMPRPISPAARPAGR